MKQYIKQDMCRAPDAILLNKKINHPANEKIVSILENSWIQKNLITIGNDMKSQQIVGPFIPPIKA